MAAASSWTAPQWVNTLYAKFPLVTLEQDDSLDWKQSRQTKAPYSLWIQPSASNPHPHRRTWASANPSCLRAQLLFLLRGLSVTFRDWSNEASAPDKKLPTLHLWKENRLIAADDIRTWLDTSHPLGGQAASLQGLPNQTAYDGALATAQLVLTQLLPAYFASFPELPLDVALMLPEAPPLSAGLTTPLPASMTGDDRSLDVDDLIDSGVEALDALSAKIGDDTTWMYEAESPTPLDALIASHLYCIYSLPSSSRLRQTLEDSPSLGSYVDGVLDYAERALPQ